jgi:hypothetical protein
MSVPSDLSRPILSGALLTNEPGFDNACVSLVFDEPSDFVSGDRDWRSRVRSPNLRFAITRSSVDDRNTCVTFMWNLSI